ncbi:MAG: hypothetical protein RR420_00895 [Anaerovoracaceae bacterium]
MNKLYELYEVIQELKKDPKQAFKIVLVKDGEIIDNQLGELSNDYYLTVNYWAKSPYIRGLKYHQGKFMGYYEGIQFSDNCRWIKTNDLDHLLNR